MTISSTGRKAGLFMGNGLSNSFPFLFKVFDEKELQVFQLDVAKNKQTLLKLGVDYKVELNPNQNSTAGGHITLLKGALTKGHSLVITSNIPNLQPIELTNQGGFYPDVINTGLDRLTIQIQQLAEQISRAPKVPITSNINPDDIVADVHVMANHLGALNIVADAIKQIETDAAHIEEIKTVSGHIDHVDIVSNNIAKIDTVAADIEKVVITAEHIDHVNIVSQNIAKVETVAADIEKVALTAEHIDHVKAVSEHVEKVDIVSGNINHVDIVSQNIASVNTVAADIKKVVTTAEHIDHVKAVSEHIEKVDIVSENMDDVLRVAHSIESVKNVSEIKDHVKEVHKNQETITAVGKCLGSITKVVKVTDALNTVAENVTGIHNFAKIYQGAQERNPISRNDETPLQFGDLYFNTTSNALMVCTHHGWEKVGTTQGDSPTGMISAFAAPKAPDGWFECDGRALSRTEYANLFAVIGTLWGGDDQSKTFNLPDFRGQFLRGWDHDKNLDETSNRKFASWQKSANLSHDHGANCSENGEHSHVYRNGGKYYWVNAGSSVRFAGNDVDFLTNKNGNHTHSINITKTGGKESRPVNYAVLYCVKY
ncbi:tail fiber protein [Bartonella queenslandensis]|uniref:tail fiber protein n=1 Tax=Bartonella queenslandensis TaxID=481138 RepID=UPI0002F9DAE8|nr:tail fiber protein [Bartonella queenslandensis]